MAMVNSGLKGLGVLRYEAGIMSQQRLIYSPEKKVSPHFTSRQMLPFASQGSIIQTSDINKQRRLREQRQLSRSCLK